MDSGALLGGATPLLIGAKLAMHASTFNVCICSVETGVNQGLESWPKPISKLTPGTMASIYHKIWMVL